MSNFFENVSKIIMRKSQYDNKLVKVQEKATKVVLD